jgi:hypothetical protein
MDAKIKLEIALATGIFLFSAFGNEKKLWIRQPQIPLK